MLFTQGKIEVAPAEIGYDEARLEVLNQHFQSIIDAGDIQCAMYCLSRHGKVFAHAALGKKSYRKDDATPADPTDIRWYASITKVVCATAIMKLVEDGKLRLTTPIGEILPQLSTPPFNGITILHLLSHTSGLHADDGCFENKYQSNYWSMLKAAMKAHKKEDGEFDWISATLGTIGSGMRTKPGEEWSYCSYGYMLLGAVIEKLTGVFSHDYIMENIAKPLGMADSCFDLTPELAKRSVVTAEWMEKDLQPIIDGTIEPNDWRVYKIPSTSGGMCGTVRDLTRFGDMFLGHTPSDARVLGRKAREGMFKKRIHDRPNFCWGAGGAPRSYCAGFDLRTDVESLASDVTISHEGAGGAALYIDPVEDMSIAWFAVYREGSEWLPTAMYNTLNVVYSGLK
ncbi:MAG: beta-lactamase family protein [Defluviitaleaceae bacterium]|nr:beta-lactamase family protein [Defluviitaleaceae bacterium]